MLFNLFTYLGKLHVLIFLLTSIIPTHYLDIFLKQRNCYLTAWLTYWLKR